MPLALDPCVQYAAAITREAHVRFGIQAPVPLLLGQARQESGCRANVTAWDKGRGLYQFMDATGAWTSKQFPELGTPNPYNSAWAIQAAVRYDGWLVDKVHAKAECDKWGAALTGYNGGLGYVFQSEKLSPEPGVWFGVTEKIPTKQLIENFTYSRSYPRKIFANQARYEHFGPILCGDIKP